MGESIVHATDGVWKRVYRIRLMFEDPVKIKECFGVDFNVRHITNRSYPNHITQLLTHSCHYLQTLFMR